MLELLSTFSVDQIVVYTIMLILAIKGGVDLGIWAKELYQKKFNKDYSKLNQKEALEQHYKDCEERHIKTIKKYEALLNEVDSLAETTNTKMEKIEAQLEQLTKSDMHDIKSWIVEKHHSLMTQGWVDDFTMDTLEKRYSDYVSEDGNSYVKGLMTELRALPHYPPK